MLPADQARCVGLEGRRSEEPGTPPRPAKLHLSVVGMESWQLLLWVAIRQRISAWWGDLEVFAIWANQVNENIHCYEMQNWNISSWHGKLFCLSGCSPVSARFSAHELQWEENPSGAASCTLLQSLVMVNISKIEVKLTWRWLGLTTCCMLQGGRFASHGCEKPCKNLTGNQDFRTVIKSGFIQIIERAKLQRGMFRLMLIQCERLGCEPVSLKRTQLRWESFQ